MSKNITIKEGAIGRNFTAKKLRTDVQGGGSCFWVPEDETRLITKRITAPGEYVAADEEVDSGEKPVYGYSKVTVSGVKPDADTKLISKSVTANGTYKVADEPVDTSGKKPYGYSTVHVNVKGGGKYTDPDTGAIIHPDPSSDPGSTIVGTNPDTGNEEAKTIDDEGNLKTLELASYIQLDTPPTKTEYQDGERIVMSGAVAHGYKKDGTPYKGTLAASELPWHQYGDSESSEYSEDFLPGGVVFNDPQYADASKATGYTERTSDLDLYGLSKPIPVGNYYKLAENGGNPYRTISGEVGHWHYFTECPAICRSENNEDDTWQGVIIASANPDDTYVYTRRDGIAAEKSTIESLNKSFTYSGKTVYYAVRPLIHWKLYTKEPVIHEGADAGSGSIGWGSQAPETANVAWTMVYGDVVHAGGQTITLTWPREGDRKFLKTTMEITVEGKNS